jgi:hypothetical protein
VKEFNETPGTNPCRRRDTGEAAAGSERGICRILFPTSAMESTKKSASRKEASAPQDAKRRPLTTLRQGDVSGSIWARDHEARGQMTKFYSVTFERSYKDSTGKYCYTRSFNPDDLGALMSLCQQAGEYINGQEGLVQTTAQD